MGKVLLNFWTQIFRINNFMTLKFKTFKKTDIFRLHYF